MRKVLFYILVVIGLLLIISPIYTGYFIGPSDNSNYNFNILSLFFGCCLILSGLIVYKKREGFRVEKLPDANVVSLDNFPYWFDLTVACTLFSYTDEEKEILKRYNLDTDKPTIFILTREALEKKLETYRRKILLYRLEQESRKSGGFQAPKRVSEEKDLYEATKELEKIIENYPLWLETAKRHEHGHIKLYNRFKKFEKFVGGLKDLNEEGSFIYEVLDFIEDVRTGKLSKSFAREAVTKHIYRMYKSVTPEHRKAISKINENKPLSEYLKKFDTEKLVPLLNEELEKVLFLAQERSKMLEKDDTLSNGGWDEIDKKLLLKWKKK